MKLPALLCTALIVAACSSVPELKQELAAKNEATASVSEMRFQPMRLSETSTLTLDSDQPAFEFPEGKSFYVARSIPRAQSGRQLKFKTYLSTQYLPKANILVPRFLFLDDSKQVVAQVATYSLRRDVDFWRGVYFEGEIAVPAVASYFVLYTTDAENPKLYSVSENGHVRLVPHAPAGTVDVKVSVLGDDR